jgi:hypothetical protein
MSTAAPRADAAASSVGARDLFVLRRVTDRQFVHFGGSGRGAGWAGLIEVSTDEEPRLGEALRSRKPVRLAHDDEALVFGPYYARTAAFVPVTNDVVVVFGGDDEPLAGAPDDQLATAAQAAADAVESVTPAKRLADELEELEAVRAVIDASFDDTREAMWELARIAAESLSCEVGAVYLGEGERLEVVERGFTLSLSHEQLTAVLRDVLEEARFPFCVQDASVVPLPGLLAGELGIRSYYLLELTELARGVLFLAHTDAAPRGFTLLCRRLGLRLAEVVSVQLGVALTREWCRREGGRLDAEFARLDAAG